MFQDQACVFVRCDRCGERCWQEREYEPPWPTEVGARSELAQGHPGAAVRGAR